MNINIAAGIVALSIFVVGAGSTVAQSDKQTHQMKTRTLSGCLQKQSEDDPNKYQLTTADNVTWEIESEGIELAPHAGHAVTVTGVVSKATWDKPKKDAQDKAKQRGHAKGAAGHGHMTVTDLKMDGDTCPK